MCKVKILELRIISNGCVLCQGNIFQHWLSPAGRNKVWRNYAGQSSTQQVSAKV